MSSQVPTALEQFFMLQWQDGSGNPIAPKRATTQVVGGTFSDDPINGRTILDLTSAITSAVATQLTVFLATVGIGVYGDGSDGAATCDGVSAVPGMSLSGGVYTLTRNCNFTNLTTSPGVLIHGAGWIPYVNGVANHAGHLSVDGQAGLQASGGVGGGGGAGGGGDGITTRLRGGLAGGAGGGSVVTNSFGGQGGASTFGTIGSIVSPPAAGFGSPRDLLSALTGILWRSDNTSVQLGGGGAGGGAGAGYGGGGGGLLIVPWCTLVGSGGFSANGGNGGGNTPAPGTLIGAGGGGGGEIHLISRNTSLWTGACQVAGGAGGSGGSAGNGAPGTSGLIVRLAA
jgi:hypothetical protein